MSTLYILQNQSGYYLKKSPANTPAEWVDGQEPNTLFRTMHKDEAVNMLFETNSQNVELRITIKEYEANKKKLPIIPPDDLPPPLPKVTEEKSAEKGEEDSEEKGNESSAPEQADSTSESTEPTNISA